jgi:polyisoprenoid-binding protein YceI
VDYTEVVPGTILAVALALLGTPLAAAQGAPQGPQVLEVDAAASEVSVHVGKAGLFSFAGHAHEVAARRLAGQVVVDLDRPGRSTVSLRLGTAGLAVVGDSEPPQDVAKIQETMSGPRVLDVARFPEITFDSTRVEVTRRPDGGWDAVITGSLRIRDHARPVRVEARVEVQPGGLVATGKAVVRQTDFGIQPVTVAGVIRVKDELAVTWRIVARSR